VSAQFRHGHESEQNQCLEAGAKPLDILPIWLHRNLTYRKQEARVGAAINGA
jgi:hypothetical protein